MSAAFGRVAALRGALLMTGSTYVVYALGLVVSALIARDIGPEDFGRYAYLVWLAGMLGMFANNGLTTTGIRFVSESLGRDQPDTAARIHGWLWRRQLLCLLAVALLYLASLPLFERGGWLSTELPLFAAVVLLSMFGKSSFIFFISMAKGYGRFGIEASATVGLGLLNAAAVALLAWHGVGLHAYLAVFTLTSLAFGVLGLWMSRRAGLRPRGGLSDPDLLARLRTHLWWTVLLVLTAALSNKAVETWLLNALVGATEVGYFAIAAALTRGGVDLLSSGLTTVLMPMMAHAFGAAGIEQVNRVLSNAVRIFQFFGLLLAGAGALAADLVVHLMYGEAYAPVAEVFRWMVIIGGLTLTEGAFGALLSTTDHQRLRAFFATASIVITAAFAVVLVPQYGLIGALWAHVASRLIVMVLLVLGVRRLLQIRLPWRELLRLLLAALLAVAPALSIALLWPDPWLRFAAGVLYALLYIALSLLLRGFQSADIETLQEALQRKPRLQARLGPLLHRLAARLRRPD